MQRILIVCNPYLNSISYGVAHDSDSRFLPITFASNSNSKLISEEFSVGPMAPKAEAIIREIMSEYMSDDDGIGICFAGMDKEYQILEEVCRKHEKITLSRSHNLPSDIQHVREEIAGCLNQIGYYPFSEPSREGVLTHLNCSNVDSDYLELGETYQEICLFEKRLEELIAAGRKDAERIRERLHRQEETNPISFRMKLIEEVDLCIATIRFNCLTEATDALDYDISKQTQQSIDYLYKVNRQPDENGELGTALAGLDRKTAKNLRKSLELEKDKQTKEKVVAWLKSKLDEQNKKVLPNLNKRIQSGCKNGVPIIVTKTQACIQRYGNPNVWERMRELSRDIVSVPIPDVDSMDLFNCFDLDALRFVERDKMDERYNELVKKQYADYAEKYADRVFSLFQKDVREILEIIADLDLESDPQIGGQIKVYNSLREKIIKQEMTLKLIRPMVGKLQQMIEYEWK